MLGTEYVYLMAPPGTPARRDTGSQDSQFLSGCSMLLNEVRWPDPLSILRKGGTKERKTISTNLLRCSQSTAARSNRIQAMPNQKGTESLHNYMYYYYARLGPVYTQPVKARMPIIGGNSLLWVLWPMELPVSFCNGMHQKRFHEHSIERPILARFLSHQQAVRV